MLGTLGLLVLLCRDTSAKPDLPEELIKGLEHFKPYLPLALASLIIGSLNVALGFCGVYAHNRACMVTYVIIEVSLHIVTCVALSIITQKFYMRNFRIGLMPVLVGYQISLMTRHDHSYRGGKQYFV